MIRPMPSPRGTNFSRMFILKGRASPLGAYDSAGGLEGAHESESVNAIYKWACENLSAEERLALSEKLQFDADHNDASQSRTPTPQPKAQPTQPQQPLAQDDHSRLPPITVCRWGEQPQVKPTLITSGVSDAFHRRYPNAAKITRG
jgi:hypothetical protein